MKDKVIILGGKGTAVVVADQIYDAAIRFGKEIEFLGFAFDDPNFGKEINGFPILCKTTEAYSRYEQYPDVKFIFQLYRSDVLEQRIALRESYGIPLERFYSFIHPTAYIAHSVELGAGNVILANCSINSNVVLGNFNTLNTNSMIGHDTILGDNNFLAAHSCIGSGLKIGNGNFVGLNASLRNFVQMGDYNLVGMASNVVKNMGSNTTVVGNPARELIKE